MRRSVWEKLCDCCMPDKCSCNPIVAQAQFSCTNHAGIGSRQISVLQGLSGESASGGST